MEKILSTERYGQVLVAEQQPDADIEQFLGDWWTPAILELASLPGFQNNPAWVAGQLVPKIRVEQAQAALDTLLRLNFLTETDGIVVQNQIAFQLLPVSEKC